MNKYTVYCTPEQTKKALELSAPIKTRWDYDDGNPTPFDKEISIGFRHYAEIPTVDQMIGWLEDQEKITGIDLDIERENVNNNFTLQWRYYIYNKYSDIVNEDYLPYSSRKEATLAAIDAALEYLANNKN